MLRLGRIAGCLLLLIVLTWLGTMPPLAAQPMIVEPTLSTHEPIHRSIPRFTGSFSGLSLSRQSSPSLSFSTFFPPTAMAGKSLFSFSGQRPKNLGLTDGKLAACPTSPNCVCSQTDSADKEHYIAALSYTTDDVMAKLKAVIQGMERTTIVSETNDYLYVEFTSKLMGYVDDVEFYRDGANKALQVRSASRLGQSDLGVNRKRVEEIRVKLKEVGA